MTVRLAMKYAEIASGQISDLIRDDNVVFEQKFDGTRVMAVVKHGEPVRFLGSGGKVMSHTATTQHLPALRATLEAMVGNTPGELVLDGEVMQATGEYHLFDVPYARFGGMEVIRPEETYAWRRNWLNATDLQELIAPTRVKVTAQATNRRQKAALLEAVREAGGEGVMAKHINHPYLPGGRSTQAVKLKFVKTADVVVTAVDRPDAKHGSFKLGAVLNAAELEQRGGTAVFADPKSGIEKRFDGLAVLDVGGASAIGKDTSIEVGDVVEVAYLYWTGEALYQPRVVKKRTDKMPAECTIDQFPAYSRATINLDKE